MIKCNPRVPNGSLLKGSFDKRVRIDLPVPWPVPTPPLRPRSPSPFPHLPQANHPSPKFDPKPLPQGTPIGTCTPLRKLPPVKTTLSFLEAQQRYFSYRATLVAIASQNSFVLVFMGYRTIIARCVAKCGIAQMCLCETKYQGGVPHHVWWVLTSFKKYRAIWGIAAIVSQYRAIWGY